MGEWRPIGEAPKDGTEIIVAGGYRYADWGRRVHESFEAAVVFWHGNRWMDTGYEAGTGEWQVVCPTHWMPIPPLNV